MSYRQIILWAFAVSLTIAISVPLFSTPSDPLAQIPTSSPGGETVPASFASGSSTGLDDELVNFSRDIRPILSDTCFKCHGPDAAQREADLRLDQKESVFEETESVMAGEPEDSELYLRLTADDPDMLMPPPDSGRSLTAEQIDTFRRWIEQGANWGDHWSLLTPRAPAVPQVAENQWGNNSVDSFVLRRIKQHALEPSPAADRHTLARRLFLDLTGLPPTYDQVLQFVNDDQPGAYERLVDRLLATPQYGEHMARHWLDVVRYGDTHGLHLDNYREHWPYRDWIIQAFNRNQPFDEFSTHQLAGDLLDNPTREQLIATGFNRAHVTTAEGGSIKEEVLIRNVTDRVSTFGTVFLGLTIGCAQCHDHKFDPVTQKEFYQLAGYFNSLDGDPMDGNKKDHAPVLMVGTPQQMADLDSYQDQIDKLNTRIKKTVAQWQYREPDDPPTVSPGPTAVSWIDEQLPSSKNKHGAWSQSQPDLTPQSGKVAFVNQADEFTQLVVQNVDSPWQVGDDDELFAYVYLDPQNPPRQIMLQWNDGNWEHRAFWGENLINFGSLNTPSRKHIGRLPRPGQWTRISVPATSVNLSTGRMINGVALSQYGGKVHWDMIGQVTRPPAYPANRSLLDWHAQISDSKGAGLPGDLKRIVTKPIDQWSAAERKTLKEYFVENVYAGSRSTLQPLKKQIAEIAQKRDSLKASIPTTLIYREKTEPRPSFFLERGEYDKRGEQVHRAVPAVFDDLPPGAPNDRLGLAQWLFSGKHPLTARVAVNRFWQQIFGRGIVETSEDFGAQGLFPTHPDLLDHLAMQFVDRGWDVKWLIKTLVMSSTYQQSSRADEEHLRLDRQNRWLARGPRFRLDAEVLRDQALAVSGLLVPEIGGPSVKPPQPDGLWYAVGYTGSNTVRFKKDTGHAKVHRRSMYTFWKRTAPPPQMAMLDAPSRESCIVRRERTNTPLQALMMMNDPQFVEAARYLAQRVLDETSPDASAVQRIQWLIQQCLAREASPRELEVIGRALDQYQRHFGDSPQDARRLIAIGEVPASEAYDASRLASWTMVANLIMNTDEFVTRN